VNRRRQTVTSQLQNLPAAADQPLDAFFRQRETARRRATRTSLATASGPYPGDFTGRPTLRYQADFGQWPSPGEVVWAWVPFSDDFSTGKDRPVLIIGRDETHSPARWLLALPLSSVDHQDAPDDGVWMSLGCGDWDGKGRESFAQIDRIIRVDPRRVRRAGGHVTQNSFDQVATQLHRQFKLTQRRS